MKLNTFKYSLVTVGVIAAMGITTSAIAATSGTTTTSVDIRNIATANYSVANFQQPTVNSNPVTIRVSEQLAFSLVSDNLDGVPGDDLNINEEVIPNGFAVFQHTLTNTGNRSDSYTLKLEDVAGDDTDYDLTNSTVSYAIYNSGQVPGAGVTPVSSQSGVPVNTANNQVLTLEKGQFIKFTINAKTLNNKGGNGQDLKLTATSTLIPTSATKTLVNTDKSITKLPVFSIVKRVSKSLDLNNTSDESTYTITVKNNKDATYAANATNIKIIDSLPAGLKIVAGSIIRTIDNSGLKSSSGPQGTIGNSPTTSSKGPSSAIDSLEIGGINLPVGAIITVTFKVQQDTDETIVTPTINHARVEAPIGNGITIIDSTDNADPNENTATYYPASDDIENINGTTPTGTGGDSTQALPTIKRALTLTNPTTKEIAPSTSTTEATGQVTHQTIITNTGRDIEGKDNKLTFTITDSNKSTAVNLVPNSVTIVYDPDGPTGSQPPQTAIAIAPTVVDGVNTYDVTSKLPAGIAPNSTVTINYNVSSTNAPLFTPEASTTATTESTVVTIKAAGTGASTVAPVTDTTNVKGLTLVKSQALDANCDGVADTTFSSNSTTPLGAVPGDCAIYQIAAFNNSSAPTLGFNIQSLTISDLFSNFSANADYKADTAKTTITSGSTIGSQAAPNTSGDAISTTITTLAPQGTATMQFEVRIKTNR